MAWGHRLGPLSAQSFLTLAGVCLRRFFSRLPSDRGKVFLALRPAAGCLQPLPGHLYRLSGWDRANAPRELFEDIDSLASTIKQHGLLEPLIVLSKKDKNGFEVLMGERRLRACRKAQLETVPCIVLDGVSLEQVKEMQLVENVQRKELQVYEEIKVIQALSNQGLDLKEIAAATGLSHGAVQNYLTIGKTLPVTVQRTIEKDSRDPHALTVSKALLLAQSKLEPAVLEEKVALIKKEGASAPVLAKSLAKEAPSKLHRVRESRTFWRELIRTLKEYAQYWSDYTTLKEWESVDAFHAELQIRLPKDLKAVEVPAAN